MSHLQNDPKVAAIILAAGKGTRLKAKDKNKVVFEIGDKPMVVHTVNNLLAAKIDQLIAVVGFKAETVRAALGSKVDYAIQDSPQGTGDAAKIGAAKLNHDIEVVLIVSGDDSAFYSPDLYRRMVAKLHQEQADIVLLTLVKDNPTGLGRIIRDHHGHIEKIVEEKVATEAEKAIKEINTSMYCVKRDFLLQALPEIKRNPVSKEFYLTDIVEIANRHHRRVLPLLLDDERYWHGVNTREDWQQAQLKYQLLKQTQS